MLQTLPIFRTLNADMATLLHCSMMRTVEANKVVVKQGEVGRNLFFIRCVWVEVCDAILPGRFGLIGFWWLIFKVWNLSYCPSSSIRQTRSWIPHVSHHTIIRIPEQCLVSSQYEIHNTLPNLLFSIPRISNHQKATHTATNRHQIPASTSFPHHDRTPRNRQTRTRRPFW